MTLIKEIRKLQKRSRFAGRGDRRSWCIRRADNILAPTDMYEQRSRFVIHFLGSAREIKRQNDFGLVHPIAQM